MPIGWRLETLLDIWQMFMSNPRMKKFNLIAACDIKNGIGKENSLPWNCRKEYAHFVKMTTQAAEG